MNETWNFEQNHNVASAVATGKPVNLAGDGRCDSPGHSAKYCTYSMQNMATGKIMTLNITQVTQAGSSNNMEKLGCVNALGDIESKGLQIAQFTTDRHVQIRKYMREQRPDIKLQFDIWHVVKGAIKKRLSVVAKKAACRELNKWIRSICNHFWWSSQTCDGDKLVLMEK